MEEELAQMRQELAQTRQELAQMRQELAQTRQRVTALETVVHNLADAGARLSVIANELADVAGNVNAAVHVAGVDAAVVEPQSVVAPVIVIFINIRGFTAAMRERTPSEAARMCHRLSTTTDAIICAAGGLIYPSNPVHGKLVKIKDIGDCQLLCVLEASPAAALLAIEACFSVLHQFPPPDLHVGIAAGNVAVGKSGFNNRIDVFGTTVNLASRLEGFAGPGQVAGDSVFGRLLLAVRSPDIHVEGPLQMPHPPKGLPSSQFYLVSRPPVPPPKSPSTIEKAVSIIRSIFSEPAPSVASRPAPPAAAAAAPPAAVAAAASQPTSSQSGGGSASGLQH
eukprot:TRINITY_DN2312_c0_g1_i3.p1 TRINITY_DN2312_c0_g1~~TRINITY_DN2312_c0_g1_i3.p1  ORF type:complete len:338 (+),score=69.83 TRINITY_DN2312_c0_g1_i3:283-1296(+)